MIGDGGNGSAELGADLRVLGVGVGETGGVVEDIGDQLVDDVLGNVVAGENDCADGDGDGVRIKTVNILADGDLGVVRGRGKQLVDVLIIERDKIDVLGRRKVSDCRCRSTRNDEGRVDLAVFQGIRAVAEGLVRRVDILLRQARIFSPRSTRPSRL